MASLKAANDTGHDAQYSIYVYHGCRRNRPNTPWEMKGVTPHLEEAMENARIFFNTRQFCKVEVKKRVYDTLSAQSQDMTIKVYELGYSKALNIIVASAALIAGLVLALIGLRDL